MKLVKYLRIYRVFINNAFSYEAQYRTDTWIKLLTNFLWIGLLFVTVEILYTYTPSIAGWTKPQLYLLTVFWILVDELYRGLFGSSLLQLPDLVTDGTLDNILVKPVSSLFMVSCKNILTRALYRFVVQLAILAWLAYHFDFAVSLASIPVAIVLVALGLTINFSFALAANTLSFWFLRIENINEALEAMHDTGRYPIDIFPRVGKILALTFIPVAFGAYLPAAELTGHLPWYVLGYATLMAALFLAAAISFWNFALRRYSSASS